MIILYVILALTLIVIAVMVIRTLLCKKVEIKNEVCKVYDFDDKRLMQNLSEAVQIPTLTILNDDMNGDNFLIYHQFLQNKYPTIFSVATKTIVNDYSLILKIDGSDLTLKPCGFLAHQDVVPAPVEGWEYPPFSGDIVDDYVYGRGTQDMKGQMICMLEALEKLLNTGFKLKRTIYFCFGHDEEYTGKEGAKNIVKHLDEQGIKFEFVVDEGGAILDGKILGVNGTLALIGICEKGYMDLELKSEVAGGHSSTPTKRTAVGKLSEAVSDVETSPMKTVFTKPVKDLFKTLTPHMSPIFKFLFVNSDILSPLLRSVLSSASTVTNGLIRTTFAPTQAKGSGAPNVLPPYATATINCRINTNDSSEKVIKHIQKIVGGDITVTVLPGMNEPTPVSNIDSKAFESLKTTISEVFDGFIPAPYPFIAATDAKYYYKLTDCVYRFTPFILSDDDRGRLHAINERLHKDNLRQGAIFFARLFENTCG